MKEQRGCQSLETKNNFPNFFVKEIWRINIDLLQNFFLFSYETLWRSSLLASSPFKSSEESPRENANALASPFACCSRVTSRDFPKWRACLLIDCGNCEFCRTVSSLPTKLISQGYILNEWANIATITFQNINPTCRTEKACYWNTVNVVNLEALQNTLSSAQMNIRHEKAYSILYSCE